MRVLNDKKRGLFSRLVTILVVLLIVLAVGFWFAARSEWGRKQVEKNLSRRTGVEVTIGNMYIGWPYQLVLENVRSAGFEAAGTAGFSLAEARVWHGFRYCHLTLAQLMVRVKLDDNDRWEPSRLERIGGLRDAGVADIIRMTKDLHNRMVLRVKNADISWLDPDGTEGAFARDVDFRMIPVRVDDRRFYYYCLNIYNSAGLALSGRRDMRREWLATSGLDYVELPGDHGIESGPDDEAWPEPEPEPEAEIPEVAVHKPVVSAVTPEEQKVQPKLLKAVDKKGEAERKEDAQ